MGPINRVFLTGLLGVLAFASSNARAQDYVEYWTELLNQAARSIQTIQPQYTARDLYRQGRVTTQCYRTYERLYAEPVLDVRLAFGYKDWNPDVYVSDADEKAALVAHLKAPCPRGTPYWACGFVSAPQSPHLLSRTIEGPDGRSRKIELRVTASAASSSDVSNRTDPAQPAQSRAARANFLDGLKNADVVIYMGHSRSGGGPDFGPARLLSNGHVNYAWYKANRPGEKMMLKALKSTRDQPKLVALLSCLTEKYFLEDLRGVAPDVGVVHTNNEILLKDEGESAVGILNALLGTWCKTDFEKAIQSPKSTGSPELSGFFLER